MDLARTFMGQRLGKMTTFLESLAMLAAIIMCPDSVRNGSVRLVTDNSGLYCGYKAGYSRCQWTYTVLKAVATVATALNIRLEVVHRKRCSDPGTLAADSVSRSLISKAMDQLGSKSLREGFVSSSLEFWMANPIPTRFLGKNFNRDKTLFSL